MRRLTTTLLAAGVLLAAPACATRSGGGSSSDSNRITAEEIQQVEVQTAYEAIQRLRPQWLRRGRVNTPRRGDTAGSRGLPLVYVDGIQVGPVDELRRILDHEIAEMRFMTGSEATTRYGTGHEAGAILVTTRRR